MSMERHALVPTKRIAEVILVLRGQKVLLDTDLAALYGVPTKRFNEQVNRNISRFPSDFMFKLSEEEFAILRSHSATSNKKPTQRGGRRYPPYAFTEHGAIMAATILNSPIATEVAVYVVRAFVQLRETLTSHKELIRRLNELESKIERKIVTHDEAITNILNTIRQLMTPPKRPKPSIGFRPQAK